MRKLAALLCAAALMAACSAPIPGIRRGAEGRRLYRAALEQQAEAERLMQTGDTAAAIPLLRDAYVGFVDSGHPEAYATALVSIWMAEETVLHRRWTEYGKRYRTASALASAVNLLQQVEAERQRARAAWLFCLAALLLLAAGTALLLQRHRRLRLETERELLQARMELDEQHSREQRDGSVTPALTLALRSYEQLCCRYVPDGDNAALLHEFRQQLADLRDGASFERELEAFLSDSAPELLDVVKSFPGLKAEDRRLLQYLAAGLPTYMIGAVLGKSRSAVNMHVSRLRSRIEDIGSSSSDNSSASSLLLPIFDARRPGRPRR